MLARGMTPEPPARAWPRGIWNSLCSLPARVGRTRRARPSAGPGYNPYSRIWRPRGGHMSGAGLREEAAAIAGELTDLRRSIHAEPEVGLDLPATQRKVIEALNGLPVEITLGRELSSVTAVLRGALPGPAVLLRADMDALPLTERSGVPYASRIPGAMHACGHDLHTAMLAGAARLLSVRRDELAGSVVFMF